MSSLQGAGSVCEGNRRRYAADDFPTARMTRRAIGHGERSRWPADYTGCEVAIERRKRRELRRNAGETDDGPSSVPSRLPLASAIAFGVFVVGATAAIAASQFAGPRAVSGLIEPEFAIQGPVAVAHGTVS